MSQEKDPRNPLTDTEPKAGNPSGVESGDEIQEKTKKETESEPEAQEETSEAGEVSAKPEEEAPETESEPETEAESKKVKNKKDKRSFGEYLHSSRFRHGSISTAFTVIFIAVVVLLNVIVGILGERFPSVNIDLTKNGTNSLSEQALKVIGQVKNPTTITILATKQQTEKDTVFTEYGVQYSQVGTLAAKIAEKNSKIKVEYVDLDKNPVYASQYKDESLAVGDVLVKTEKRYRLLAFPDLYNVQYNNSYNVTSNVEEALVSAVNTVNTDTLPVAVFDTGHSERGDMSGYRKLLESNNFETKDINLLTDQIPDGTQFVVMGDPTSDLTENEIKKLDAFLKDSSLEGDRSLMVTYNPGEGELSKLSDFLKEWGISVPQAVIVESDQSRYLTNTPTYLFSDVQSKLKLGGASESYKNFITPQSAPVNLLFEAKGDKSTYSLAKSSSSSYLVDNNTKETDTPKKESYNTAVLSQDTVKAGDKSYHANVVALGSTWMFSNDIIYANTFGNGKYLVDLSKYATGTNNTATEINIPVKQANTQDITLNSVMSSFLGLGVFTFLFPLIIAVLGITVYHKRRNL